MESRKQTEGAEGIAPANVTVTAGAQEVLAWRSLARQALPMLTRPEQFHLSQRSSLAQTMGLLLDGDLELEDVFGETDTDGYEPGCCAEDASEEGCEDCCLENDSDARSEEGG